MKKKRLLYRRTRKNNARKNESPKQPKILYSWFDNFNDIGFVNNVLYFKIVNKLIYF